MKQTEHYQLNQWEASDRILMEDFNNDNAKLDAALAALAQTVAGQGETMAGLGNCGIVTGSYVGSGTFGSDAPNTLTFSHKPILVFIQTQNRYGSNCDRMILMRGANWGYGLLQNDGGCAVTWGERSVSWYTTSSSAYAAPQQMNMQNVPFLYVALVVKE